MLKNKKKLCFLLLMFFLFSCSNKNEEKEKYLSINVVNEIPSLDPRKARDLNSIAIMKMIYEGLTRISKDGEIENAILDSYEISEDGKTYIFHLKDTYWFDGTKVTSFDFINSWKKALSKEFISSMAYKLFPIKGAKDFKDGHVNGNDVAIWAIDDQTIKVELENQITYFLEILSLPVAFPIHPKLVGNEHWDESEETYIGNGPFKIKKWKRGCEIELEKNFSYFEEEKVKLNKIVLCMVGIETELSLYETSKIDLAGSPFSTLPNDLLKQLSERKDFQKAPFLGTSFLRINMDLLHKEMGNKNKTQDFLDALYYSVNRKSLVKHVLHNTQEKAYGLLPPNMLKRKFVKPKKKDAYKIENILKNIEIIYPNSDRNNVIMQALQQDFEKKLKIKVILKPLERKMYFDKLYRQDYCIALCSWIADFNDPMNFLDTFKYKENGINNTGWENQKYIDLLDAADVCIDLEKREELILKAHDLLIKEKPIIPLYHLNMCFLKKKELKDVAISKMGHADFKWAFFENH